MSAMSQTDGKAGTPLKITAENQVLSTFFVY
jgi:hypothetical protein